MADLKLIESRNLCQGFILWDLQAWQRHNRAVGEVIKLKYEYDVDPSIYASVTVDSRIFISESSLRVTNQAAERASRAWHYRSIRDPLTCSFGGACYALASPINMSLVSVWLSRSSTANQKGCTAHSWTWRTCLGGDTGRGTTPGKAVPRPNRRVLKERRPSFAMVSMPDIFSRTWKADEEFFRILWKILSPRI